MGTIEGAVVVVTGAGRGIGRAIAEELGHEGARVVVNYSKSKEAAEDVVARLRENGSPEAVAIQADVSDVAQAAKLIEETISRFGRVDVLVNNAGINIDRTMKNLPPEDWNKVIQVDLNSYYYTVKAALPYFMQQKSGKIINISSKSAALELARFNVTVNAICPGYIATEMFEAIPEKTKESVLAGIPLGRAGTPREVARAVRYLIIDGDYYTGATLSMNGGIYMQ
jgi:acetoacetyl-CoA reductase